MIKQRGWIRGALCSDDGLCIVGAILRAETDEAVREFALDCIRKECRCHLVTKWNDEIARTTKQVINMLTRAADRASSVLDAKHPRMAGRDRSTIYS